ncbi:Cdc73 family RNA polymerase II accessory factor [Schizosaccharomyces japonicus yFS275]|uniref:Cdc73 family RNA polymerase II accessory factor n=1 Tax=Schizosaccharomyces japonicus (strain yFS275 / FY16936) TaxID=402676 RepID=B6JZW2_SCHJY|nr:Cdc73 family RNA polymerase II accessory factor [Schizosaccharomyces japonicus yFS275]EEB06112.1 Cdc73 family RNA polymerase II accessory factor [Schizosaccharomyces japonicus yFS275]
MDPLVQLRECISKNGTIVLLSSENPTSKVSALQDAHFVQFGSNTPMNLSLPTRFIRTENKEAFPLQAVVFAWLQKEKSIADYIQQCSELGIKNLTFLERTDLISWLEGAAESEHIVSSEDDKNSATNEVANTDVAALKRQATGQAVAEGASWLKKHSRTVADHNSILHGTKPTNFLSLRKDVLEYLNSNKLSAISAGGRDANTHRPEKPSRKNCDPIILLSPSASSLLTMQNVKRFLEDGVFVPPAEASKLVGGGRGPELIALSHKSSRAEFGTMRFIVVEGVEKFKPDYWDRVVCVFTTGQAWQFKDYKWSEPHQLFHHVKGFLVQYVGDPPHPATRDWNVEGISVERLRRHTDREVVSQLWDKLERWMETRWPLWHNRR